MHHMWNNMKAETNRRSFVKNGLSAAGIATAGIGFLANGSPLLADEGSEEHRGRLTRGDAALLRFAAAAEILETVRGAGPNVGARRAIGERIA